MLDTAQIIAWLVVGTKMSFAALVAPTVFQVLEPEPAGRFLRRLFPRLYAFCALLSLISASFFGLSHSFGAAITMAVIGALHLVARGPLTQRINDARDAELAGDTSAKVRFDRLHKLSVRLFSLQLLGVIGCAIWTVF